MMEQSIHSSCSPARSQPLVAMHRAVTAHVSLATTVAAIKASSSVLTAHHHPSASTTSIAALLWLLVAHRSVRMVKALVRIVRELDSMPTTESFVCRALLDERQPLFAPPHGHGCPHGYTSVEHWWCFVMWYTGTGMQPATSHIILMLEATPGATGTAWLSAKRSYAQLASEIWALSGPNPTGGCRGVWPTFLPTT